MDELQFDKVRRLRRRHADQTNWHSDASLFRKVLLYRVWCVTRLLGLVALLARLLVTAFRI